MNTDNILEQMARSVINLDSAKAESLADLAVEKNYDLHEVIEAGFGEGIRKAGELWEEGTFFLPELMMSAEIMKKITGKLLPHITQTGLISRKKGKIIIGTVQGDIHDIGKTLVATLLQADGFEVIDLGADVKLETFVDRAQKESANMLCMSALLTTTMTGQKTVIEMLESANIRNRIRVMVGGAPVNEHWAFEIGADGYASNAVTAVAKARSLLEIKM